jgi:hypothetical protein
VCCDGDGGDSGDTGFNADTGDCGSGDGGNIGTIRAEFQKLYFEHRREKYSIIDSLLAMYKGWERQLVADVKATYYGGGDGGGGRGQEGGTSVALKNLEPVQMKMKRGEGAIGRFLQFVQGIKADHRG